MGLIYTDLLEELDIDVSSLQQKDGKTDKEKSCDPKNEKQEDNYENNKSCLL